MASKRTTQAKPGKSIHKCHGGPWHSHALALTDESGSTTAWLTVGQWRGRYVRGKWEDAADAREKLAA
jgi:hypothetical protein